MFSRSHSSSDRRLAHLTLLLLAVGLGWIPAHVQAQAPARPYLQQLGNDQDVSGLAVAANGYSFVLLSSGTLRVAGPDQILREPLKLIEGPDSPTPTPMTQPVGIAVSPSGGANDTKVDLFVLTRTKVLKMSYDTEDHENILRTGQITPHSFPATDEPVAITVAPGVDSTVWIGGRRKLASQTMPRNFLLKLTKNLAQPDPSKANLKIWGVPENQGTFSARGENQISAITADASGNVFVAGRWPAVYNSARVDVSELYTRTRTWSVNSLGGLDLPTPVPGVQVSVINYKEDIMFIWKWGEKHRSISRDAENRTAYIVKWDGDLKATHYTQTTEKVPHYVLWNSGTHASNLSTISDIRLAPNNYLYAVGNWEGYSNYNAQQTVGQGANTHVLKFNAANLSPDAARARVEAAGGGQVAFSLDVDDDSNVYVTGLTQDAATNFQSYNVTEPFEIKAGRGVYIGQLDENMKWKRLHKSNTPTPLALRRAVVRWNGADGVEHAQMAGSFTTGQLSMGQASRPAVVPTAPVEGAVNYYALVGKNGGLINQINVTIRSEFVRADQIRIKVGDYSETYLNNFDPVTKEGTVGLLSSSAGERVSISVPPNIYFDSRGEQLEPTFFGGNEKAPEEAVSRHQSVGFSVSGEAATGATNTYTFPVSTDAKVIFNWRTEHALVVDSRIKEDAAPSLSSAMGNPAPEVNKHWFPANEPVTAFIDNAAAEYSIYGKRYRVIGFDATGSILERPTGGMVPPLPPGRILNKVVTTILAGDKRAVQVTTSTSEIKVGWLVEGEGIPPDTTIVSLAMTAGAVSSFRLSREATTAGVGRVLTFRDTKVNFVVGATMVPENSQVTLAEQTSVRPGWLVSGPGVLDGTRVLSVTNPTTVVLSKAPKSFRRIGRLTAPEPAPVERITTIVTSGSISGEVSGANESVVQGMQVAEVPDLIPANMAVVSVSNNSSPVSTRLTSGSKVAYIAYNSTLLGRTLVAGSDPILTGPQIVEGTPVSGTGLPNNTRVEAFDEEVTQIAAELTPGSDIILLPPLYEIAVGVPVRPELIGDDVKANVLSPQTEVAELLTPVTVTNQVVIQGSDATLRTSLAFAAQVRVSAMLNPVVGSFAPLGDDPRFAAKVLSKGLATISGKSATFSSGTNLLTVTPNVTGLIVGCGVSGAGIPADSVITAINTAANTVTIDKNVTTTQSTAGAVSFTIGTITLDRVASSSQTGNVTFTNNQRTKLNKPVLVTAAGTENLFFLERFKLTLSNAATQNLPTANLSYVLTRTVEFSHAVLGTNTTPREDELDYVLPLSASTSSVVMSSTVGLKTGMLVGGPGIAVGTVISQISSGTSIVISKAPASSGSFVLDFFDPNPALTFFSNFGSYTFFDQDTRQQVPQWIMNGPATITYRWKTQFHVMVSTTVQTAQDFPEVRLESAVPVTPGTAGYGIGEHWFDIGSDVYVGGRRGGGPSSRELDGWLNATVPPFPSDRGSIDFANTPNVAIPSAGNRESPGAFYYFQVSSLGAPVRVLWNYGSTIHRVLTKIGEAVNFDPTTPELSSASLPTVVNSPPDRAQVVEGPPGSAPEQMYVWDALDKKLYPLRPGKTLYEYGDQNDPIVVEVTSNYPAINDRITHITHPDLPGVILDPSSTDKFAFQRLAFSSGNGSAEGGSFISTQSGQSVLVFSQRGVAFPDDSSPANGDLNRETLKVQVVETKQWDSGPLATPTSVDIGKRVTKSIGPSPNEVLDTGFVVHKNALYNANVYDRSKIVGSGPIIPVNQEFTPAVEDDLIVIWYAKPDNTTGITWTHSVQAFKPQWPTETPRIVIASRLGSEGKNRSGVDQLVFTRDKYADVQIYNQPDRELPGYNPNEEHALIAPSLKFLDQANPPPAAYALQSGLLNVPHDESLTIDPDYTSNPYVLVQYFDVVANEAKMTVYAIELEDSSAELNPYIDPRNNRHYNYTFDYLMTAGEPVQPPYPLARVIGLVPCPESFGVDTSAVKAYWEDYNGVPYAAGQGVFNSHFYYRLLDAFWGGEGESALSVGDVIPFGSATESSKIQLTGTVAQNLGNSNAFDGSQSSPTFSLIYTASANKPNPVFIPAIDSSGYSFQAESNFQVKIDDGSQVKVSFTGSTAQSFLNAINGDFNFINKLKASLTAEGLIRLELLDGNSLTLTDGTGAPLLAAGMGSGELVPEPSTFLVDIGDGNVLVNVRGRTAQDMINGMRDAFPGGEVSATYTSGFIRLLVNGSYPLSLTDGIGLPLKLAGFGTGNDQPFVPVQTTTVPGGFVNGSQFLVNLGEGDITVTLGGQTTQYFINAVNNNTNLTGKLTASLTLQNRIRLTLGGATQLTLKHLDPLPTGRLALDVAGLPVGRTIRAAQPVQYRARWPENPPILKAGETLTYAGGEYRADNPTYPGLPGVIGWGVGEVIFDSMNPTKRSVVAGGLPSAFGRYTARLIAPLEPRRVSMGSQEEAQQIAEIIQPASGLTRAYGTVWRFTNLPASLARRLFYDPLTYELGIIGYVNDKTLGDTTLTAAPPPLYVLEPNIITSAELDEMLAIPELASNPAWFAAVSELYRFCRNPNDVSKGSADVGQTPFYAGLTTAYELDPTTGEVVLNTDGEPKLQPSSAMNAKTFGPGLALVPSPAFLDPNINLLESYVTLVENNDKDIGGPVTLRIVKVVKDKRFRGAIKTITSDNVFSEQLTLRHSGDFGGNPDDIVYQWYYREEDGTEAPLPPHALWNLFPDTSNNELRGKGQFQIELKGNPILLLADQLFFLRYRHVNETPAGGPNSTNWAGTQWEEYGSEWAGAANSRPGDYQPQLAMGWVKRVLDRINPYEARFNDFRNNDAPSTYVSMILQAGQQFEGPVALNPDKNVVENVGLIELYETVLARGRGLSIDLSTPVVTGGINNALLLAATRVSDLYMLLGNEAYSDAQDPTIGFGSNSSDFGSAAGSIFAFQNQQPSLLEEELALLRGVPRSYGRPVYNRLFWNFTKSEGEVAYAMNYNLNDINKDGFIDEKDAMIFFPQGHGDAWGHYSSALKSQYNLLRNKYFNWVSRSEFYNLLDVVIEVDYYDERKFADAAAARAKAGAEIVDMTYRARYVEDPDGQWQGYSDTDADRAWGVDGWAKRAGQAAYLDWVMANALIPSRDDTKTGLRKVDRTTVTAIHNVATQLAKIQATEDNSSMGLNPLGISPDAVPMDFDPVLAGPGGSSQFEQMAARAEQAITNAFHIFEHANLNSNRLRMQGVSANDFSKQTYEQDRDYRNRLIEIFGTPYSGQIGPGKLYPTGYSGPDLALYMYVDVNDLNDDTVPPPAEEFKTAWTGLAQINTISGSTISLGAVNPGNLNTAMDYTKTVFSKYFLADVIKTGSDPFGSGSMVFQPNSSSTVYESFTGVASYFNDTTLDMNLPISAKGYSFSTPEGWGMRSSPGELQATLSELIQAQAALGLAVGDYDYLILEIDAAAKALQAQHGLMTSTIRVKDYVRDVSIGLNAVIAALHLTSAALDSQLSSSQDIADALAEVFPRVSGLAFDVTSPARASVKMGGALSQKVILAFKLIADAAADAVEIGRDALASKAEIEIEKYGYAVEIQQKLKEIELMMWNEASSRVAVFEKLEAMRQISDRYRSVLQRGLALLDERADFNRQAAGATQALRYQDMAFRVFRNDALQKYRASFDLAQKYTYLAAKAYDYETNLAPTDPGSSLPMLQEIVRTRVIGDWFYGVTPAKGGLGEQLVKLRGNYEVLKGRLGLNNPQVETSGFSLRSEQARTDATGWRQLLQRSRHADLWEVPEFRRYCRPPRARSAGKLPGLVIEFSTETVFGRNFFGKALAGGDNAFNPTNFANKIAAAGVSFVGYPVASLAATPQIYLVPAGLDVMTIPNSLDLNTRQWNVVDQALPVPFPVSSSNLANTDWIPVADGLNGPLAEIRRFSSFRAGVTAGEPPLSRSTRLAGRSVWNTKWLLIIPGGSMLNNGENALEQFINRVTDIQLHLDTYGYSGN
jgi:hypothetical protein